MMWLQHDHLRRGGEVVPVDLQGGESTPVDGHPFTACGDVGTQPSQLGDLASLH